MPKKFFKVDLIPALRRLEVLSKGLTTSRLVGAYKSVFKGKGLEFSDYRQYNEDDDAGLIDWKASVRSNDILVKQYVEERELNIFFILDCSSRMLFGSAEKLKAEYNIELTASLSHAILEAGDNVGIALYSDDAKAKLAPSRGKSQFYEISRLLLNPEYYHGKFDLENAVKFVFNYLKEAAVVIIISDFLNWKDEWEESLKLLTTKFDVICLMIRDPRDKTMPEEVGEVYVQDPNSEKTLLVEPALIKQAYEHNVREQENRIRIAFLKNNIDFAEILTDKSFVKPIVGLFLKRTLKWK